MISHQIRRLRMNKGLSRSQLAELLDVSTSAVGMYEQGRREPDIRILTSIASIFEVSLDYLITGEEFPESIKHPPEKKIHEICPCNTCYWKRYNDT